MKRVFIGLVSSFISCASIAQNGNVGIGTMNPKARLHVTDSAVVFTGADSVDFTVNTPVNGRGIRMMWFPSRAAFRFGYVDSLNWDRDSIGFYSVAGGYNSLTSGTASSNFGYNNRVTGSISHASGYINQATGYNSFAHGSLNITEGAYSHAHGYYNHTPSTLSMAFGYYNIAKTYGGIVMGILNDTMDSPNPYLYSPSDRIFQIGNGDLNFLTRHNALTVLRNGNIGIGIDTPDAPLEFPPQLGKKITLYPGNTGDVGLSVFGNQLRLYADHPGTSVKLGYDQGGTFTNNFEVVGNGRVVIDPNNSNTGIVSSASLIFGGVSSGEGIISKRTATGNQFGLDFFTGSVIRLSVRNNGNITMGGMLGIGTETPLSNLHVNNGGLLMTAPYVVENTTPPPVSGMGTRMMWYQQKAALRAGTVDGNQWNEFRTGLNSIAVGYNVVGEGNYSASFGSNNRSDGASSFTAGANNNAYATYTFAGGFQNTIGGSAGVALGQNNLVNGIAGGAIGNGNTVWNEGGFAAGRGTTARGFYSVALGQYVEAKAIGGIALGSFNNKSDAPDPFTANFSDRVFQIGTGDVVLERNAITILRNGNIGLGTTVNPQFKLSFDEVLGDKISLWGAAGNHYGFGILSNRLLIHTDAAFSDILFGHGYAGSFTETVRFMGNGFVGIGLSSPTERLHVNGNVRAIAFLTPSDVRYKQNISSLHGILGKILLLNPVSYEYTKEILDTSNVEIGFVAQELEKQFPELVKTDKQGFKSVDYAKMSAVLTKGMQEQQKEIDDLKKELTEIKKLLLNK